MNVEHVTSTLAYNLMVVATRDTRDTMNKNTRNPAENGKLVCWGLFRLSFF